MSNGLSVQPISLTSCTCKLFETIIKNQQQYWAEIGNLFPDSQYAFKEGKSCDNLVNFTLKVNQAFRHRQQVLVVFLDIQTAFDNVNVSVTLTKFASFSCPYKIIK